MTAKLTSQQQIATMQALSQGAAAWLVGLSTRTFRDTTAPRGSAGLYNARDLLAWKAGPAAGSDDPLLTGGDSPNLERYRAAKADLAEMDALERRGRLVDVDAFAEWWGTEVAAPMRRAVETLQSRFGADAAEIVAAALRKVEPAVGKRSAAE